MSDRGNARHHATTLAGLVVVAFCAGTAPAWPDADAPPLSPAAGSDELLKLRRDLQGELRLTYRQDVTGRPSATVTIGLAGDYDYVDDGSTLAIHDYRLRRILVRQPDHRFLNSSLFAEVWVRGAELENRVRVMRGGAAAGGLDLQKTPGVAEPFWIESELGMVHQALAPPALRRTGDAASMTWQLDSGDVAAAQFKDGTVPDEVRPGLRRLLATATKLHPAIADTIAARGQVPWDLRYKLILPDQRSFGTAHWTLAKTEWVAAARYPLPPGLKAAPGETSGAFPDIFAALAADVAQRRRPPPDSIYVGRIRGAIARRAGLEAFLWVTEMQLAAGPISSACPPNDARPFCRLAREAGPLAKEDPRTAIAFAPDAPTAADRRKFDDLPNAYLLGLLFATRPHARGADPAIDERALLAAIKASPVANFAKDIGDFYLQRWDPVAAWQAWDLGRAMAGHRQGDLLDAIDTRESQLVLLAPSFF